MDIGELLRNKRNDKGLTQRAVADAVGVSEGTVSRWESGKIGNMRRDRIQALANILSIDPVIITKAQQQDTEKKVTVAAGAAGLTGAAAAMAAGLAGPAVATAGLTSALAGAFGPLRNLLLAMDNAGMSGDDTQPSLNECPLLIDNPSEIKLVSQYRLLNDTDKAVVQSLIESLAQKYTASNSIDKESMPVECDAS
jgi:transcriptional regulator with XRE-family HTH domain